MSGGRESVGRSLCLKFEWATLVDTLGPVGRLGLITMSSFTQNMTSEEAGGFED